MVRRESDDYEIQQQQQTAVATKFGCCCRTEYGSQQSTMKWKWNTIRQPSTVSTQHTKQNIFYLIGFSNVWLIQQKCGGWQKLVFLWWILSKIFFLSKSTRLRNTKLKCARYEKCAHCIHISSFQRKQKTSTSTHTHTYTNIESECECEWKTEIENG